ncbi:MAG TPA: hypothetical protein VFH39_03205 [Candidatus Saccharimonadales bacterium]|nr:hypothetical protein [Candidatus Saccharimonadales bacterium]
MANQKSSKVFDVAKPGKSAPSSSAKPIIITNRPVLKDPMVTDDDTSADEERPAETRTTTKTRVQIKPIHDLTAETADDQPETAAPETPATTEAEAPSAPDLPAAKASKPKPPKPVAEKAEAKTGAQPRIVTGTTDAEPKATAKPETSAESAVEAKEPATAPAAPAPESESEAPDAAATAPAKEPEATEEPKDTAAAAAPAESPAESDPSGDVVAATGDNAAELAAKREQERAEELEKLALSRKYYLPINQTGRRHARHMAWLGVFVIILLALAWADVALDAGLIKIPGVKAPVRIINK